MGSRAVRIAGRGRRIRVRGKTLGKSERPSLKNKLKQKGLGVWFKWESAYLASVETLNLNPLLPKN
jgi:hypothetical protein